MIKETKLGPILQTLTLEEELEKKLDSIGDNHSNSGWDSPRLPGDKEVTDSPGQDLRNRLSKEENMPSFGQDSPILTTKPATVIKETKPGPNLRPLTFKEELERKLNSRQSFDENGSTLPSGNSMAERTFEVSDFVQTNPSVQKLNQVVDESNSSDLLQKRNLIQNEQKLHQDKVFQSSLNQNRDSYFEDDGKSTSKVAIQKSRKDSHSIKSQFGRDRSKSVESFAKSQPMSLQDNDNSLNG